MASVTVAGGRRVFDGTERMLASDRELGNLCSDVRMELGARLQKQNGVGQGLHSCMSGEEQASQ